MGSDNSLSPKLDHSEVSKIQQASKKRKDVEKTVVTVKIGTNNAVLGKLKHEGPPSDSWSWRKYGQKPIKGSPHPRGYYRCSTSKGCSAKKQVERCKTDDSLLIITYTSSHNHPGPHDDQDHDHDHDLDHNIKSHEPQETSDHDHQQIISPTLDINNHDQDGHISVNVGLELLDQQDTLKTSSTSTSNSNNNNPDLDKEVICNFSSSRDENDFFDELEELPTYSKFKSIMRTHLYDEIRNYIPIVPS